MQTQRKALPRPDRRQAKAQCQFTVALIELLFAKHQSVTITDKLYIVKQIAEAQ